MAGSSECEEEAMAGLGSWNLDMMEDNHRVRSRMLYVILNSGCNRHRELFLVKGAECAGNYYIQ